VETTAKRAHRTPVEGEAFIHANHYLAESLEPVEFAAQDLANSKSRHERLQGNFAKLQAPITMDACWAQLSDVVQGAAAAADPDYDGVATCAAVVQCPAERTLYVCAGGPRPGNQEVLTL
jgi:hypothetical protein